MDWSDIEGVLGVIVELWGTSGRVGPILAIAVAVVGLVSLARRQLTEWVPWLATRRGALTLVALFAAVGSAAAAALEGETSVHSIVAQAVAAALTAVGLRSSTKAAITGGAATMTGHLPDGTEVEVFRHEHIRPPADYETHPERYEPPSGRGGPVS